MRGSVHGVPPFPRGQGTTRLGLTFPTTSTAIESLDGVPRLDSYGGTVFALISSLAPFSVTRDSPAPFRALGSASLAIASGVAGSTMVMGFDRTTPSP